MIDDNGMKDKRCSLGGVALLVRSSPSLHKVVGSILTTGMGVGGDKSEKENGTQAWQLKAQMLVQSPLEPTSVILLL